MIMRQELVEAAMAMGGGALLCFCRILTSYIFFFPGVTGDTYAHIKLQLDHYGVP